MSSGNIFEKVILGTVQLGIPYGINNTKGKPELNESLEILAKAYDNNIRFLDTADAYGEATKIIGAFHRANTSRFNIITKFSGIHQNQSLEARIRHSLQEMAVDSFYAYLFHKPSDFLENPSVLHQLENVKRDGFIQHIGVSIYTNNEFEAAIDNELVDLIQIPFNLLDNNNLRGELIRKAKNKKKIVHTRSVFLQGLFFKQTDKLPEAARSLKKHLDYIQEVASSQKLSVQELAINYVLTNPEIDGVIFGVESLSQLEENIETIRKAAVEDTEVTSLIDKILVEDIKALNPGNWK